MSGVSIKPIIQKRMIVALKSTSPMIQHKWGEKAKTMMREKQAGKKSKTRDIRNPEQECLDATHFTSTGKFGFPAGALKQAIIGAAHKNIGIEKTLVRKALFVNCPDPSNNIEMKTKDPVMREDMMRVGMGAADLRYRPEFAEWSATVMLDFNAEMLTEQDIVTLLDRAGFGVGLLEGRPEKGRDNGRFEVDMSKKISVQVLKK